jgi:hypothetical protein
MADPLWIEQSINQGFQLAQSAKQFQDIDPRASGELWKEATAVLLGVAETLAESDARRLLILSNCGDWLRIASELEGSLRPPASLPVPAPADDLDLPLPPGHELDLPAVMDDLDLPLPPGHELDLPPVIDDLDLPVPPGHELDLPPVPGDIAGWHSATGGEETGEMDWPSLPSGMAAPASPPLSPGQAVLGPTGSSFGSVSLRMCGAPDGSSPRFAVPVPESCPHQAASRELSSSLWRAAADPEACIVRSPWDDDAALVRFTEVASDPSWVWTVPEAQGSVLAARLRSIWRAAEQRDSSLVPVRSMLVLGPPPSGKSDSAALAIVAPSPIREGSLSLEAWLGRVTDSAASAASSVAERAAARSSLTVCGRPVSQVRGVFGKLWQALSRLHALGLPGCVDARSIVVHPSAHASPDISIPIVPLGTAGRDVCAAPELSDPDMAPSCLGGGVATRESDVFLVAGWLLEAVTGRSPLLPPGKAAVDVPAVLQGMVASDAASLVDLLRSCLRAAPASRPSAADVSAHHWFFRSHEADLRDEGVIASADDKLQAVTQFASMIKASDAGHVVQRFRIKRSRLCWDTLRQISTQPAGDLAGRISVVFEGEAGSDAGGLTAEMFNLLFDKLCSPSGPKCGTGHALFVCAEAPEPLFLPPSNEQLNPSLSDEALVAASRPARPEQQLYEGVGRALAAVVLEKQAVPARFAPSLWKHLLGLPPSPSDLAAFDPSYYASLGRMGEMSDTELEFLYETFEGLLPGGDSISVTSSNVRDFVERKTRYILCDSRKPRLDCIARGFRDHPLYPMLKLLSYSELVRLVCGVQDVTGPMVARVLAFQNFPRSSAIPGHFRAAVESLTPVQASKFLLFATASTALPAAGRNVVVRKVSGSGLLPVSHTCFFRLDVCDDDADAEEVARRVLLVTERVDDSGFGIA